MTALARGILTESALALILQTFGFRVSALLANTVNYAVTILIAFIIASILINLLFPGYPSTRFFQVLYDAVNAVVNPILAPIRSRIPPLRIGGFGLDLSPMIAIFGLTIMRSLFNNIIIESFIRPVTG